MNPEPLSADELQECRAYYALPADHVVVGGTIQRRMLATIDAHAEQIRALREALEEAVKDFDTIDDRLADGEHIVALVVLSDARDRARHLLHGLLMQSLGEPVKVTQFWEVPQ